MSGKNGFDKENLVNTVAIGLVACFVLLCLFVSSQAYGIEVYSKNDAPFGSSLDSWMTKWWNWWIATTVDEATPKPNGCLINKSDSMVMLMETAVDTPPTQVCKISSKQGIIVPNWVGFFEASKPEFDNYSYEQLSKAAREQVNLGAVTSQVKVDGIPISKLDELSSMRSGQLNYKINSMDNVTEIYSKGFNITIPETTHFPDQNPGTWRSGWHGWVTFLKPLPPGHHIIDYNVGVTGTGPNDHAAQIRYSLDVE
jgi:hypothetical protein